MEIKPDDIQNLAREYERVLQTGGGDVLERLIILEENQIDYFDCLLRTTRNARIVNYLKNLAFRALAILSTKNGQSAYIPSVRSPESCANSLSRALNTQVDIFILLDKYDAPFADKAELISLENRKAALIAALR